MNQYTRIGNTWRSHDQAGNTISSSELGVQRFFDAENRLVQWTQGAKDIRYRYDALGRRVLKQDANASFATILYFYDGWHDVEETTAAGVVTKRFVFGENVDEPLRVTLPDVADVNGNSNTTELIDLYYHQNSLGSVVALTTASGTVVESYRYSAYGQPRIFDQSGTEVSTTQVEQPFMFTGRRWDFEEASGLYYYRHRYYDPAAGRFGSRDPKGLWGDAANSGSGQAYCGGNPVNRVDPYGLETVTATTIAIGAAEGAGAAAAGPIVVAVVIAGVGGYVVWEFYELLGLWNAEEAARRTAEYMQKRAAEHAARLAREAARKTAKRPRIDTVPDMDDFPEDAKERPRPPLPPPGSDEEDDRGKEHQHHVFPQEYAYWFLDRYGINVDEFTVILPAALHDMLHCGRGLPGIGKGGWWNTFLIERIRAREREKGQRLTREEVLEVGQKMLDDFQLGAFPYPTRYWDCSRRKWGRGVPLGPWL
ncbi:MAG: DUF2380 domain-containing protein [Planctomycetes bacterium]|nr:DUF2380 domain-containing protein [Planctomycetota bacterium]